MTISDDTIKHLELMRSRNGKHWFQVFTEKLRIGENTPDTLNFSVYGTIDDKIHTLRMANAEYGAVCVQIQDVFGRDANRIKHARFIFLDFDNCTTLPELPLPPSMIVKTPNGYHVYWSIEPTKDIKRWKNIMKSLIEQLGADTSSSDRNKCVRLAGFYHQKGNPVMISIIDYQPERIYVLDDFRAFDRASTEESHQSHTEDWKRPQNGKNTLKWIVTRAIIKKAVAKIMNAPKGSRYATLGEQTYHLAHFVGYGITAGYIHGLMHRILKVKVANDWSDIQPIVKNYEKYIDDSIRDGINDKVVPFLPLAELERWAREDEQDQLLELIASSDLGERLTMSDLKNRFPYDHCFTQRQFEMAMSKILADLGYEKKRMKYGNVYALKSPKISDNSSNKVVIDVVPPGKTIARSTPILEPLTKGIFQPIEESKKEANIHEQRPGRQDLHHRISQRQAALCQVDRSLQELG